MYVMQYEITVPADYDMAIIRRRVASRGVLTDSFPGLGLKAYCIRERGSHGSPVNQYAPFYVWASLDGMTSFLLGEGFRGLAGDFGRPPVRRWTAIAYVPGPSLQRPPRHATRRTFPIPPSGDMTGFVDESRGGLRRRAETAEAHSAVLAIDTWTWELAEFTLWAQPPDGGAADVHYEVLHLSAPDPARLARGWP